MKTPTEVLNAKLNEKEDPALLKLSSTNVIPLRTNFNEFGIPVFVMAAPNYMQPQVANNIWIDEIKEEERKVNVNKAMKEFYNLYNTIVQAGGLVYLVPPQPDLQDLPFTANLGTVLPPHIAKNTFVPSTFRSKPRNFEQHTGRNYFAMMGFDVINSPYFNEGYADFKWVKDKLFIGGYGIRTDIRFHRWFEEKFGVKVISVKMNNPYLYHFDCNFFALDQENIMLSINDVDFNSLKVIEKEFNIIDVNNNESMSGTCNSVKVNSMIINHTFINTLERSSEDYQMEKDRIEKFVHHCSENGKELVLIDISEFLKLGALVSCCVLPVNYGIESNYTDDGSVELREK